jgi:hypothetical protein
MSAADLVLILHFGLVLFIVAGAVLIVAGIARGWCWTRSFCFRTLHLAAIVVVALEALLGVACPLTVWEHALRSGDGPPQGFVARWIRRLLFYDFPDWAFTTAYVLFALAIILLYVLAPPRRQPHTRR